MGAALWSGLTEVLAWPTCGYLLLGCVVGLIVGILPGLGPVFAITIFLPIAIQLDPVSGLVLIVSIWTVAQIGGEVTSVLFAVPGELSTVTTILDGHPLARQGRAGFALAINFTSNLLGVTFGAVILFLAVPIARPLILHLGNPELFMCVLVGVTFVGSLTGERPLIGYTVAAFGFLLALVGTSVISGAPRYTFGVLGLWEGIPLISFALGFFAVPEVYRLYTEGNSLTASRVRLGADFREGIVESFRHWRLVLACSSLGVVIGLIPGLGGSVSQWVSYSYAKRRSKTPELFGHGAVEGLIGPSASCTAKDGGHLLPTLFFGIPASVSMALLLTAMLALDVTPGPKMVTEHLDVTMAIISVLVVSCVLGIIIMTLSVKRLIHLASMPTAYMVPFLMVLILVAAYSARESMLGVTLLIIGSVLGVLMEILGWPRAPFILAFVLAPLAEKYLFLTQQTYGWGAAATRPGVLILFVIMAAVIVWTVRGERARKDAYATVASQR
jgi:putative tricarboxylic transport membrane protein